MDKLKHFLTYIKLKKSPLNIGKNWEDLKGIIKLSNKNLRPNLLVKKLEVLKSF